MKGFADSFNNSGVRLLDCIYHRTPKLLKIAFKARDCQYFAVYPM